MSQKARIIYSYLVISFISVFSIYVGIDAQENDKFFSYEKFLLNQESLEKIPVNGKIQLEVKKFTLVFLDAVHALSNGDLARAKTNLVEARKLWPEYFGVDFLLALVYEKNGDYAIAARYYKSYLNKLKDFYDEKYRISGSLIRSLSHGPIEEYNLAYEKVKTRLNQYNINIDKAMSVFTFPIYLLPTLIIIAVFGLYVITCRLIWPHLRKLHRIHNPPEGFWICRYCDTSNPILADVCIACNKPK